MLHDFLCFTKYGVIQILPEKNSCKIILICQSFFTLFFTRLLKYFNYFSSQARWNSQTKILFKQQPRPSPPPLRKKHGGHMHVLQTKPHSADADDNYGLCGNSSGAGKCPDGFICLGMGPVMTDSHSSTCFPFSIYTVRK